MADDGGRFDMVADGGGRW